MHCKKCFISVSGANRYSVKKSEAAQSETVIMTEGLRSRRARPSSIQAAMELKAKRATTQVIYRVPFEIYVERLERLTRNVQMLPKTG